VEEVAANGGRFRFTYDGLGPFARCVRTEGDGRALYRDLTSLLSGLLSLHQLEVSEA
jgi:hypothetical protein